MQRLGQGHPRESLSQVRYQFNGKQAKVRVPSRGGRGGAAKPVKPANTVTFEQLRAVSQTVKAMGGFNHLNQLLGLVKDVGGLRKMKDLLEAISLVEAGTTAV